MADHRAQVEDLLADYRRSREQLGAVQRSLASVRETAADQDGLVAVTVSAPGTLVGLVIADGAYRSLRPVELSALVVRLTAEAAAKASRAAGAVIAPVLPPDTDPEALLRGTADLTEAELTPAAGQSGGSAASAESDESDESYESYEDKTWLEPGGVRHER